MQPARLSIPCDQAWARNSRLVTAATSVDRCSAPCLDTQLYSHVSARSYRSTRWLTLQARTHKHANTMIVDVSRKKMYEAVKRCLTLNWRLTSLERPSDEQHERVSTRQAEFSFLYANEVRIKGEDEGCLVGSNGREKQKRNFKQSPKKSRQM